MKFDGIHHITAITGDAPRNVDFYTGVLGLRLTAKTVNHDDPTVYHLFYGDELARPAVAVHPEIPAELALQGFEGVRAYSLRPDLTGRLLEDLLGAESKGESTWELRGQVRGGWIALDNVPEEHGRQSAGVVHHIAWA